MKRSPLAELGMIVVLTTIAIFVAIGLGRTGWLEPHLAFAAAGGVAVLAAGTLAVRARIRSRRRDPADDPCPGCGYSLRGNRSGVCPECGMRVSG